MNSKKYFNAAVLLLVYGTFSYIFWPFKQAIVFAILFAFALNPLLLKIQSIKKYKMSEMKSITLLVISLIGILFLPLTIIIIRVAGSIGKIDPDKISELPIIQKIQYVAVSVFDYLNGLSQNVGLDLAKQIDIKSYAPQVGKSALDIGTGLLSNIPSVVFQFLIFIIMLYYFLINQNKLKNNLIATGLLTQSQVHRLSELFESVCNLVLVSTLLIAALQATVVAFASFLVGYDDFLIIFMIAFFMSFIPAIGSAPLTVSLIAYSALNGNYVAAVVLSVAAVLASLLDNVIKSYLFSSKKDSANPVILLLSIIGALSVFGISGLFLGPIITELALKIGKIIAEE